MEANLFKHIKLSGPDAHFNYTSVRSGGKSPRIPERNRRQHGARIYQQLEQAWQESENEFLVAYPERTGIYLEFISSPGFELMIKSLEDLRQGIRLCNVRTETRSIHNEEVETTLATVFIPRDKREFFFRKVEKYLEEETKTGKPRNADLINSIEELRTALLIESFWTDDKNLIPEEQPEWCEVWLRSKKEYEENVLENFETILSEQQINSNFGYIKFPERIVKLVLVNREQLQNLSRLSDDIAEYRKAKDTAEFFLNLEPFEQQEWIDDLLNRLSIDEESQVTICLLDTGVNNGHPLISPVLNDSDCLSVKSEWGTHDHNGHGTLMAGVSAYNNLQELFESSDRVILYHRLESVKILPPEGKNDPELWGDITSQAISLAEINSPEKKRIICSAVTASDTRDRGRPTSWSGAIDNITSGAFDNEKRLMIIAAGNTNFNQNINYPNSQITDSIHDPGQSWNALTVGAYTKLTDLTDSNLINYQPLAQQNQISPFTTSSSTWEKKWPIKPEVVFEGGNVAVDNTSMWTECNDFSLISTYYKPTHRLFEPFNMTSAATAQAANFAARIQAMYPDYWPETIRGLIVHSANWPEALFRQFVQNPRSKRDILTLLRIAGYGVPNIDKALYCAVNSLTLIAEAEIQPFFKESGKQPKTNEMHLYRLPWPTQVLQELGEAEVKMKITLSYFVEPGPGEIGWKDRYRYPSHGLRFSLNSPTESENEFIRRINKAVRDDERGHPNTESPADHWVIGQNRDKGSIHSDIWQGTAVELASSNLIAIYPSIGWWRERPHLEKVNNRTRYSLIISIETEELDVDIYTPLAVQVEQQIPIEISTAHNNV
ncbi:MAG: S8 family peptidase [Marinilabiliales bacterium]